MNNRVLLAHTKCELKILDAAWRSQSDRNIQLRTEAKHIVDVFIQRAIERSRVVECEAELKMQVLDTVESLQTEASWQTYVETVDQWISEIYPCKKELTHTPTHTKGKLNER